MLDDKVYVLWLHYQKWIIQILNKWIKMPLRLLDSHQRKGLPGVSTTQESKPYIILILLKNLQADS